MENGTCHSIDLARQRFTVSRLTMTRGARGRDGWMTHKPTYGQLSGLARHTLHSVPIKEYSHDDARRFSKWDPKPED
jgi:hypothetical protein